MPHVQLSIPIGLHAHPSISPSPLIISSKFDELGHEVTTLAMPYIHDSTHALKYKIFHL